MVFESGLELSGRFYREAVRPILDSNFPGLPHAAALMGRGSEVLGFDDPMSTDHDWLPRIQLFLRDEDLDRYAEPLREQLPSSFAERPPTSPSTPCGATSRGTSASTPRSTPSAAPARPATSSVQP
jgi:hypothetical protein